MRQSAAVRCGSRLTVAHVDEVTLVANDGLEASHNRLPRLHPVEQWVPNLDGHNLGARRDAVSRWLIRKRCRDDPGHMRPVRRRVDYDRERLAGVVDVDPEIQQRVIECGVLQFVSIVGQKLLV